MLKQSVFSTDEFKAKSSDWIFCQINGDEQPGVLSQYGVSAFPTLVFLNKDGSRLKTVVGGLPLASLLQTMDSVKAAGG
jgi:thioredoxin-like negative regulator of GroEL